MPVLPPVEITPDARPPAPFGLFSVAPPSDLGDRETGGVTYTTICDPATAVWPMPCTGQTAPPDGKSIPDELDSVTGLPFAVQAGHGCPLVGMSVDEHAGWAVRRLEEGEQHTVETVLWDGTYDVPGIATSEPVVLGDGAAVDFVRAVSLLEGWLRRSTAEAGVIHANAEAGAYAAHYSQISTSTPGQLTTGLGTSWAFGGGYPTTGPHETGTDPAPVGTGQFWMFATRTPSIRRSAVDVPATAATGALDLTTNLSAVIAERIYVLEWPCQAAGVLVDTALCPCGSPT